MVVRIWEIKKFSEALYPGSFVLKRSKFEITLSVMIFEIIDIFNSCQKVAIGPAVEDQGHKPIGFETLHINTHKQNVKYLLSYHK